MNRTPSRHLIVDEVPAGISPSGDPMVLEVSLAYDEGGPNYFTGVQSARGYYVSVTPVTVGKTFRSFAAFSGTRSMLAESPRFSAKKLASLPESRQFLDLRDKLVSHVSARTNVAARPTVP